MNRLKLILLLFLSIFIIENLHAQNQQADSLEKVLRLHKTDDTIKVNLLNEIAQLLSTTDFDKSLKYATQSGVISDKLKYRKGKAESIWLIGVYYARIDKQLAIKYFKQAIKIAEEIKYKKGIALYVNSLGNLYSLQGLKKQAFEYYQKALKISEELRDKQAIGKYLSNR